MLQGQYSCCAELSWSSCDTLREVDNLRNTLREVIRENGISPNKLMEDWDERAPAGAASLRERSQRGISAARRGRSPEHRSRA